jgi:hypothetical protein
MKQASRKASKLSDSLQRHLNAYALAASAAGVGMLAPAQPAEAKIIYNPADKWLPLNHKFYLDLNHDGTNDFRLRLFSYSLRSQGFFIRSLYLDRAASSQSRNAFYSSVNQVFVCAAPLPKGTGVGPKSPFPKVGGGWMFIKSLQSMESLSACGWGQVQKQAYVGLRFAIKGQVHYGWARIGHVSLNRPIKAKLTGYAYETIPNKPIVTGKTHGPDVITLQRDSLGALAAGASKK